MHVLSLVLVALLLSISAALSAVIADDKKVQAVHARDDYTKELSDLGRASDAREMRSVGENALAEYIVRRLAETEQAIDVFAARQKTLLRQDIAEFALSFVGPSEDGTSETRPMRMSEPKKQAASREGVQGVVDEKAQDPPSDYGNANVGNGAGYINQGQDTASALGDRVGNSNKGQFALSLGPWAGNYTIAVGWYAGYSYQREDAIAIGTDAGSTAQNQSAIAIGLKAGQTNQGSFSVALGAFAGEDTQHSNTIIISASGAALNSVHANSFYVKPIRGVDQSSVPSAARELRYDTDSGEIFFILTDPTAESTEDPTAEPTRDPAALPTAPTTSPSRPSAIPASRPVAKPKSPTKRPSRRPTKRPSKKSRSVRV